MYGVNSYRHPRHTELHGFVCTGILVLCELLRKKTAVPPTMLTEAEQLCLWRRLFVVVGRQEMRSCWGFWLCAWKAYRRARPGQEQNTNHLLTSLAGLMEMRNSSFSAMHHGKEEPGYTMHHHLSPSFHLLYSKPPSKSESIIAKQWYPPFIAKVPFPPTQDIFCLISPMEQFMEALQRLPARLVGKIHPFCFHILPSVSIHSFWKLCGLPFPLCPSKQDLGVSFAYLWPPHL